MERLEAHRVFFANLITSTVGVPKDDRRLVDAFASTPRENFLGPGPWKVFAGGRLVETPSADPCFLYQDVVVNLSPDRGINNGQPTLHALCLNALNIKEGETVVQVGAGTGYYTAILAKLTGPAGSVIAYEIEPDLAQSAVRNLKTQPNVTIRPVSAAVGVLPGCDAIYVNAGATDPLDLWLNALRPNGRLLFPLTPSEGPDGMPGVGGMLLLTRATADSFHARFLSSAIFIPCVGARDEGSSAKLTECFRRGDMRSVHSLHRNCPADQTCWCSSKHWWLSTSALP
jgi:protein-L-isoaspartate(D-aspartate) O-methyltransferase